MSKLEDIESLVALALRSPVREFSLECEGVKISFKKADGADSHPSAKQPMPVPAQEPVAREGEIAADPVEHEGEIVADPAARELALAQPRLAEIASAMIGTFYLAPEPEAPHFVKIGDAVARHTVVGVVEAMKLYHEVQAETEGVIEKILVGNGQLVQYGQPLFLVRLT